MFKPKRDQKIEDDVIEIDKDKALNNLRELLMCKTISKRTHEEEDDKEFKKLLGLLPKMFPNIFSKYEFYKEFEDRGILIKIKGESSDKPSVLMAHYDVVDVDYDKWEVDPFGGIIKNGSLYGRGALDTKETFHASLFSVDYLLEKGFVPKNDIYLAFSGGEEVNGPGAIHIVDYFKENGITPNFVIDEGGAVVENVFPGVRGKCAVVGIAEKGMVDIEYKIKSNGGHASAPKPHTPIGELAKACAKIESKPTKFHLTKPVKEMFDTLGRESNFLYRMIFANLWLFKGILNRICIKGGGEINALVRTTIAFTQAKGSTQPNVIPPEASLVSNIRINPDENIDMVCERLKKIIDNDNIELSVFDAHNPSPISETDCDQFKNLSEAIASTWKGSIVSPYLMVQCSDSRHYGDISKYVYKFSACDMTNEERKGIHGNNERIRLETLYKSCEFYIRLVRKL